MAKRISQETKATVFLLVTVAVLLIPTIVFDVIAGKFLLENREHFREPITVIERVSIPTTTDEETPAQPIIEEKVYKTPLSHDVEDYITFLCESKDINENLIFSMIETESQFQPDVISSTNDYGLMQLNISNHGWLRETYEVTDFLNPYDNVRCGIGMMEDLLNKYEDLHFALMAYNLGEGGAKSKWEQGIIDTEYSRKIVEGMRKYE